jgi:outer membrane protein TolC
MKRLIYVLGLALLTGWTGSLYAQSTTDSLPQQATLENCIQYAMRHFPLLQQNLLDQAIADRQIKSKLSEWYPQVNLNANYQNNFQLPTVNFAGNYVHSGTYNTSQVALGATQNIFNRDAMLASRSAKDVRLQARQTTASTKIDVTVNVSKAFYDVLLTEEQIQLLDEDIVRLQRSLKDAYEQYKGGLVDKTDYKTATITLNNSTAQKKTYTEALKAKKVFLKEQMGYTGFADLNIVYDSTQMQREIFVDTLQPVNISTRIEYQLLQTQKNLQHDNLRYYQWAYVPNLNAFGNYNLNYLHNEFSQLYKDNYPTSYAGLQFSLPIFQGTKRRQDIKVAELQLKRIDWDIESLKTSINTDYANALASYKSYLFDYYTNKDNVDLAKDVYSTVQLQYHAGIKAYLDVITAETNLRNAQSNYANSLYQLLSSKLDVLKSLGSIQY